MKAKVKNGLVLISAKLEEKQYLAVRNMAQIQDISFAGQLRQIVSEWIKNTKLK